MAKKLKIHFVGIKGVGMTPLAIIAKEAGFDVSGSDIADEFITDEILARNKIFPLKGFSEKNISSDLNLVVTTGAHRGLENIEVKKAIENKIKVISQGEAVGLFMEGKTFGRKFEGISIAGTHGKTTTTAMLATILKESGLDPSYVIGTGDIPSLDGPGHYGKGKFFIAEADEYAADPKFDLTPKFLFQNPQTAIITNIEFDHPDMYGSLDEIANAFLNFSNKISKNGVLIACGDDKQIRRILSNYNNSVITYGFSSSNDYIIKKVGISGLKTFFWVETKNTSLGEFCLNIPGEHYALDALGAILASLECGSKIDKIKHGLLKFTGTKRRFEYIGKLSTGALLFDDYAHHPTEIRSTLKSFKQAFPKKKIVCVFQPHTYSRTNKLFEDFIYSFNSADIVLLTNIYFSLREKPEKDTIVNLLFEKILSFKPNSVFIPSLDNVIKYIEQKKFNEDYIIVTMGAGDIYKIKERIEFEGAQL